MKPTATCRHCGTPIYPNPHYPDTAGEWTSDTPYGGGSIYVNVCYPNTATTLHEPEETP